MWSGPIVGTNDRTDDRNVACGKLLFKRLSVAPDVIGREYEEWSVKIVSCCRGGSENPGWELTNFLSDSYMICLQ